MSYARFKAGVSDVYVYLDAGGVLRCCGCWLHPRDFGSYNFTTTAEVLAHLDEHRKAGHLVPARCVEGLKREAADNDAWIAAGAPEDWPEVPTPETGRREPT